MAADKTEKNNGTLPTLHNCGRQRRKRVKRRKRYRNNSSRNKTV